MTERITKPRHAITLTSYAELEQFAQAFGAGKLNLLMLAGAAGIANLILGLFHQPNGLRITGPGVDSPWPARRTGLRCIRMFCGPRTTDQRSTRLE